MRNRWDRTAAVASRISHPLTSSDRMISHLLFLRFFSNTCLRYPSLIELDVLQLCFSWISFLINRLPFTPSITRNLSKDKEISNQHPNKLAIIFFRNTLLALSRDEAAHASIMRVHRWAFYRRGREDEREKREAAWKQEVPKFPLKSSQLCLFSPVCIDLNSFPHNLPDLVVFVLSM